MIAVVFDMDGVLFDTETVCRDSWIATAEKFGYLGMEKIFPKCVGLNANDSRQVVISAYGEDFPYVEFRKEASEWFWEKLDRDGIPVKAGVRELLAYLRERKALVALASSTRRSSVEKLLKVSGLDVYFSRVITGDMVEHSKPQPDIYLIACRELGVEPGETYAIEDSYNGIRSAYAAGMRPLMVPDMLPPTEEMNDKSVRIFEDLSQVLTYFKKGGEQ